MTDGMESGMVVALGVALGVLSARANFSIWTLALVSAVAVVVRVEFMFVVTLASFGRACVHGWISKEKRVDWLPISKSCAPLWGGLIGLMTVCAVFGHILPDTALAKRPPAGTSFDLLALLQSLLHTHVSASMLGIGLFALWIASTYLAFQSKVRDGRLALLSVNIGWPVFVILLIFTQQQLQGIRYFFFLYSFLIAWNASFVRDSIIRVRRTWVGLGVVLLVAWMGIDCYKVATLSAGRSDTWRTFSTVNLSPLRGRLGIAWDIGFVGYFTDGQVLDVNGLVNGRETAQLTERRRLELHARHPISFAFVNEKQLIDLSGQVDVSEWGCVLHADFPNASGGPDRHWLLVPQDLTQQNMTVNETFGLSRCSDWPSSLVPP
jgi:hypothetical protein